MGNGAFAVENEAHAVVKDAYVVIGFDNHVPPPARLRDRVSLHRVAFVLPAAEGADAGPDVLLSLVEDLEGAFGATVLEFVCGDKVFGSAGEYRSFAREARAGPEGGEGDCIPAEVRFIRDGELVAMESTECRLSAGGPFPYSDALTFSFYFTGRAASEIIGSIEKICERHAWRLRPCIPADSAPGRRPRRGPRERLRPFLLPAAEMLIALILTICFFIVLKKKGWL